VRLARSITIAAVEQQDAGEVERQPALEVARHQLGGDRGAHVVRHQDHGVAQPRGDRLHDVSLARERVDVTWRLIGEAKAEEVEAGQAALGH
jgi:hypothetical protein